MSKKGQGSLLKLKKQVDTERYIGLIGVAESRLLKRKTANVGIYKMYLTSLFENLPRLLEFYIEQKCAFEFLNYMGRQKAEAEVINIIVTGGKKYRRRGERGKMEAICIKRA
jgi:hypothetical protein